jgi:type 1 glutamine amidotransferase
LRPLNIVLVAGPKDHGPGEHDYPRWQKRWKELLGKAPRARVAACEVWPDRGHWDLADVIVFYFWNHAWADDKYRDLDAFLERGGGLVFLHSSVIPQREPEKLAARIGLAWEPDRTKFRHGPLELKFAAAAAEHPIARGFSAVSFVDETYWPLVGNASNIEVLATAVEDGKPQPILWTRAAGKGRVFVSILGHYYANFDDPLFRLLILRAIAWTAGEPAARFESLAGEN